MRIKIIKAPKQQVAQEQAPTDFKYGGQNATGALDIGQNYIGSSPFSENPFSRVAKVLPAVPREEANTEMERGETLVRTMPDGSTAQFNIEGQPHSNGGTPILAKANDFVFSKTKKMKIGGPILEYFGKPEDTKKKYTPAQLAKQYDINKFQAILADPNSDQLQIDTATRVIKAFETKLGGLALVQEAKKGFPTGIPELYLKSQEQAQEAQQTPVAKYGGTPKFQGGGPTLAGSSSFSKNYGAPDQEYVRPLMPVPQEYEIIGKKVDDVGDSYSYDGRPITPDLPIDGATYLPGTGPIAYESKLTEPMVTGNPYVGRDLMDQSDINYNYNDNIFKTHNNEPTPPGIATNNNPKIPFGYRNQDKAAMALAALQMAGIKKYPGYIAQMNLSTPTYSLPDNAAEKAAIASAANTQSMIGALSQRGQGQRANDSAIWGDAINRIQGSEAQLREKQIGISNQGQDRINEITNKQIEYNSNRITELYKQGIVSEQQYDNAMRAAQNNLLKTYEVATDNRSKIDYVNRMNMDSGHFIFPGSGKVGFNPAYNSTNSDKNDPGEQLKALTSNLRKANPSLKEEEAYKMAYGIMSRRTNRNTLSPNNQKNNRNTQVYSPYDNAASEDAGYPYTS